MNIPDHLFVIYINSFLKYRDVSFRMECIDWLLKSTEVEYKIKYYTFVRTIAIFDLYLDCLGEQSSDTAAYQTLDSIKGLLITCLLIATKYEDVHLLALPELLELSTLPHIVTETYIRENEMTVLDTIRFNVIVKNIYDEYINYMQTYYEENEFPQFFRLIRYLFNVMLYSRYYVLFGTKEFNEQLFSFTKLLSQNQLSSDQEQLTKEVNENKFYSFFYLVLTEVKLNESLYLNDDDYNRKYYIRNLSIPVIKCKHTLLQLIQHFKQKQSQIEKLPIAPRPNYQIELDYDIDRKIGEGTFGQVFVANLNDAYPSMPMQIAIKRYRETEEQTEDGIYFGSLREITALILLKHPNIITFYGYNYTLDILEVYLENMKGTLAHLIENSMSTNDLKFKYILDILKGIQYMHSLNIIHRDLSSSNILYDKNYTLKIADFGSSRKVFDYCVEGVNYSNNIACAFVRPIEIFLGATMYNKEIDIWAVGCLMYFILEEKYIFHGRSETEVMLKIFQTRGTPNPTDHPKLCQLSNYQADHNGYPQYNKQPFTGLENKYSSIVPIIYEMFDYDSSKRPEITDILNRFQTAVIQWKNQESLKN